MLALGMRAEDVRSLDDLQRLPILERSEAREAGETRASTAAPLPTIRKNTSGSSGQPLAFGYDLASEHWRQATKLRGYGWAGYRVGARSLHYWGGAAVKPARLARAKIALDRALKRETYVDCGVRGDAELARVADVIRKDPPDVIVCYAQAGADLARWVNANRARGWGDIHVLSAAERLFPADRAAIEEAFGPHVFETYGSREVMLMAAECEAHDGMHLSMENLLVELVVRDGATERPAQPGETGEVVVTDLHNFGMPFVRYATGDLAVLRSRERCACGRSLPRLASVDGRVTETLRDGAGGRISGLIFNALLVAHGHVVRAFQVVQHRDDSFTMRVVGERFDAAAEQALRGSLAPYLRGLPLRIERVADIPTERSGKRKVVIVER
jgi:phenylacetate-CoA ligase